MRIRESVCIRLPHLAAIAFATCVLATQIVWAVNVGLEFGPDAFGLDYALYLDMAEATRDLGFQQVYRMVVQDASSPSSPVLTPGLTRPGSRYAVFPGYPPPFIWPFELLVPLPYRLGLLLWTALNVAMLSWCLVRMIKTAGSRPPMAVLVALFASAPVVANFWMGQINSLLALCLTEFSIGSMRGREGQSGLWLAGLLAKPQAVFLLLPGLLIGGQGQTGVMFFVGTGCVLAISLCLAGAGGLIDLDRFAMTGLPLTAPALGMNWRAAGIILSQLVAPELAWSIALLGTAITAAVALLLWRRPAARASSYRVALIAATFAATNAATAHAHVHMALPLVPLLVYLSARRQIPDLLVYTWALFPPIWSFLLLPYGLDSLARGMGMLAVNLALVVWGVRALWDVSPAESPVRLAAHIP